MNRDDELDPLRRAWSQLDAPDPERALDEPDEATHAALEWMRGAWSRVEPPPMAVPKLRVRRARRAPRWTALAAAAGIGGLLLWAALVGEVGGLAEPDLERDSAVAQAPVAPGPAQDRPDLVLIEADEPAPVEVAAVSHDRMELRSGPVHLILLTENTGRPETRPEDG